MGKVNSCHWIKAWEGASMPHGRATTYCVRSTRRRHNGGQPVHGQKFARRQAFRPVVLKMRRQIEGGVWSGVKKKVFLVSWCLTRVWVLARFPTLSFACFFFFFFPFEVDTPDVLRGVYSVPGMDLKRRRGCRIMSELTSILYRNAAFFLYFSSRINETALIRFVSTTLVPHS